MYVSYLVLDLAFASKAEFKERFFEALDALSDKDFEFVQSHRSESATQLETRFSDDPETSHITIIEDHLTQVRYLEVASVDEGAAVVICGELCQHMPVVEHDRAVTAAMASGTSDPVALYQVAYSAPSDFHQPTFDLLRRRLRSDQPDAREHAAVAAGLIGWQELVALLDEAEQHEPPGRVKKAMQDALRSYGIEH